MRPGARARVSNVSRPGPVLFFISGAEECLTLARFFDEARQPSFAFIQFRLGCDRLPVMNRPPRHIQMIGQWHHAAIDWNPCSGCPSPYGRDRRNRARCALGRSTTSPLGVRRKCGKSNQVGAHPGRWKSPRLIRSVRFEELVYPEGSWLISRSTYAACLICPWAATPKQACRDLTGANVLPGTAPRAMHGGMQGR